MVGLWEIKIEDIAATEVWGPLGGNVLSQHHPGKVRLYYSLHAV